MTIRAEAVITETQGAVLHVTLNRPDVRNALTPEIEAGLVQAVREAETPRVRAVVITGRGPAFCAGANMRELRSNEGRDAATLRVRAREIPETLLLPLMRLEKPVVAALNGPAVGAGIGIALAADYRVCAQGSSFMFVFRQLGLVPDLGVCWSLPRLVGHRAARDILFGGLTVAADEALSLGLVDRVVPDNDLMSVTSAFADQLSEGPTLATGFTKQLLLQAGQVSLERSLEQEVLMQATLVGSNDHLEGVAAHTARRPPQFRGC